MSAEETGERGLASVSRAAEYLDVSRQTVYKLLREGKLGSVMVGRSRRVTWTSLQGYVRGAPPGPPSGG